MRKYLLGSDLKDIALRISKEIYIRTYDERGNSKDEKRSTTEQERKVLFNIAYGALYTLNAGEKMRSSKDMEEAVIDNAEITLDLFLPKCNGYLTIYCPLHKIIREWEIV